jgi:hypothetical protein
VWHRVPACRSKCVAVAHIDPFIPFTRSLEITLVRSWIEFVAVAWLDVHAMVDRTIEVTTLYCHLRVTTAGKL